MNGGRSTDNAMTSAQLGTKAPPPGVVVAHHFAGSGLYVGSPAIVILPDGGYVATHDLFGPGAPDGGREPPAPQQVPLIWGRTCVFGSSDRGRSWTHLTDLDGQFFSNLFTHGDALYVMGTSGRYGDVVIRRSTDGGRTWTEPRDERSGRLVVGCYHTAPVPVIQHEGRLWRGVEEVVTDWPMRDLAVRVLSCPDDVDLLNARNWTLSESARYDRAWVPSDPKQQWLEGNVVPTPDGGLVNMLRTVAGRQDRMARVRVSRDGKALSFDPNRDFVTMPGAGVKFTVRFDDVSGLYWSLVNPNCERHVLSLISSPDLKEWTVEAELLRAAREGMDGFQYPDWQFDGKDMIVASRTAFDDEYGGPPRAHDANFLTFHRVHGFRSGAASISRGVEQHG